MQLYNITDLGCEDVREGGREEVFYRDAVQSNRNEALTCI